MQALKDARHGLCLQFNILAHVHVSCTSRNLLNDVRTLFRTFPINFTKARCKIDALCKRFHVSNYSNNTNQMQNKGTKKYAPLFETVLEKSCKYVMCFNKQEVCIGCTCFLSNEEALDNWEVHMQNHGCLPISGQFQTTIKKFQPFFNRLAKLMKAHP